MTKHKKERIEIQLDPLKDAELIQFIDENGSTRAGFIKFVLRHYMNSFQVDNKPSTFQQSKTDNTISNQVDKQKKKAPKLGQSFSSNDFLK